MVKSFLTFHVFWYLIYILTFSEQSLNPPVLIFVQNKDRAKDLYKELRFDDIRVDVIHSDLPQLEVILNSFYIA